MDDEEEALDESGAGGGRKLTSRQRKDYAAVLRRVTNQYADIVKDMLTPTASLPTDRLMIPQDDRKPARWVSASVDPTSVEAGATLNLLYQTQGEAVPDARAIREIIALSGGNAEQQDMAEKLAQRIAQQQVAAMRAGDAVPYMAPKGLWPPKGYVEQQRALAAMEGMGMDRAQIEQELERTRQEVAAADARMRSTTPALLDDADRFAQDILARQARLKDDEWVARYPAEAAADKKREQARLEIGRVLGAAVECGLMDEQRAVSMILVGGINDRDLTSTGALDRDQAAGLVAQVLQQGVRAKLFTKRIANEMLALALGSKLNPPEPIGSLQMVPDGLFRVRDGAMTPVSQDDPVVRYLTVDMSEEAEFKRAVKAGELPSDGYEPLVEEDDLEEVDRLAVANWPESGNMAAEDDLKTLVRVVPRLTSTIRDLVDLIYDASVVYPCHNSSHRERHQVASTCQDQYAGVGKRLLRALGMPALFQRRVKHTEEDGSPSSCCLKDGNTGTWVRYGQTINPDLLPKRPEPTWVRTALTEGSDPRDREDRIRDVFMEGQDPIFRPPYPPDMEDDDDDDLKDLPF